MHIQYSLRYWSSSSWTIAQVMKHFPSTSFEQVTRYPTPRYFCVVRFQVSMREVQKMTSFRFFFFFSFLVIPKTSHSTTRILVMKFLRLFRTIFSLEKHHVYQINYCKCLMLLTVSQELVFPGTIHLFQLQ